MSGLTVVFLLLLLLLFFIISYTQKPPRELVDHGRTVCVRPVVTAIARRQFFDSIIIIIHIHARRVCIINFVY